MKTCIDLPGICSGLFLSLVTLNGCSTQSQRRSAETDTIVISSMKFNPAELTLAKGDTVVFVNRDLVVHDITGEPDKAWTSSNLTPGQSFRIAVASSASYYCSIHPTMKGKLIVRK